MKSLFVEEKNIRFDVNDLKSDVAYQNAHLFANGYINNLLGSLEGFEWNRWLYDEASFDDINFRYKNNIFSVLFNIYYNGKLLPIDKRRKKRLLETARKNNLVPCIFPIEITYSPEEYDICCKLKTNQFNLIDMRNHKEINPIAIASDDPTPISHYELLNKSVKIIAKELQKRGYPTIEFYDDPNEAEDSPRIWFIDEQNTFCWVVVKYFMEKKPIFPNTRNMVKQNPLLAESKGYFAPVVFEHDNETLYAGTEVNSSVLKDLIKLVYAPYDDVSNT